ncbi:Probable RNA-directed DNA polymerase from transposon BS [Eumeta japonica]|uniref:Probable RNA-directed DNA polymerase from transposon BS n=1 Tax=Eumeta variegata TaxID=151549 RepID=A0A4C1U2X1_EUMVA|nr:Probable RNA-directed DNA polymerase from transposon BS [Eumeta japonica]
MFRAVPDSRLLDRARFEKTRTRRSYEIAVAVKGWWVSRGRAAAGIIMSYREDGPGVLRRAYCARRGTAAAGLTARALPHTFRIQYILGLSGVLDHDFLQGFRFGSKVLPIKPSVLAKAEALYNKGGPGQCYRWQRYGYVAANFHVQPRCVEWLTPHWTNECSLTKEQVENLSWVNCGQNHTANYRGCPKAPKTVYKKTHKTDKGQNKREIHSIVVTDNNALHEFMGRYGTGLEVQEIGTSNSGSVCFFRGGYPNGDPLYCFDSDHRQVRLRISSLAGGGTKPTIKVTEWKIVSTTLEEADTPALNNVPDITETTDEIDSAIGAFTNHIRTVVERSSWVVPVAIDRRKLPADAFELLRAKNVALCHAYVYSTRKIVPKHGLSNDKITKALKSEGYLPTPPLLRPDSFLAIDDQEKAECIVDSIQFQCSHTTPPHDNQHIQNIEEEVRHITSFEPHEDLPPVSLDKDQKLVKILKAKKAPGLDGIRNKEIILFSILFLSLLVAIFNACLKNCCFPPVWKEAEVIGILKPGKSRNLPASYRPISLLRGLSKLYEKILKARLSEHLFRKGLIIDELFGFRPNHSFLQQALYLVEYITESFKTKKKTVAVFFAAVKVFDRVWLAGLLYKLHFLQVPDRLIVIIHN